MTARNYPYLLVVGMIIVGWCAQVRAADDETTPTSSGASAATTTSKSAVNRSSHHHKKKSAVAGGNGAAAKKTASAGSAAATVAHKKSHSKAHATASVAPRKTSPLSSDAPSGPITTYSSPTPENSAGTAPVTVTKASGNSHTQITISAPVPVSPPHAPAGPEVETGLPIARHSGSMGDPEGLSRGASSYQIASTFPVPSALGPIGSYTPHRVKNPLDNFTFTNFARHMRNVYPWKINIFTTKFWIGEGSTPISSTTNISSAWDVDWRDNNGGSDSPDERRGYMPAYHAARLNPFYVALPFNDLAFPDKARRWLPAGWNRPPKDGKQVSACKDRWVEIKNAQGDTCYAQWEDVGPLRYDHAEYVFGDDRPDTFTSEGLDRAGLDVSPAVADYLDITGKNCMTRWRFVDDADVVPGKWLQYDEEAVIFRAMHELKDDPTHVLPIERATAPIDDENDVDSAKKRLGAAKG